MLLFWEFPSLIDSTFFFFLGLHCIAFVLFHSERGTHFLLRYRKSANRKLIQETFKGYGKGYKLFRLIAKGIDMSINPFYFSFLLIVRGSISAFYKSVVLCYLLKKKELKLNKPIENIKFNALPALVVYVAYISMSKLTTTNKVPMVMENSILSFFVPTMIVIRSLKTTWKVLRN